MELSMKVEGMTCGGCVANVTKLLKAVDGVEQVTVTLQPGEAKVTFDPARTGPAVLRSTIEDAGYDVVG